MEIRKEISSVQEALKVQNEQLKAQLMATSMINEITKVMLATPELDNVFTTILLGIQETLGFERVILFEIDKENFCLKPKIWRGIEDSLVNNLRVPLGFMGGATADAVFLNRHIIMDTVDKDVDPIALIDSKAYLAIPFVSKISRNCWEHFKCGKEECPVYCGPNPACWSVPGSCLRHKTTTEDERRIMCMNCELFKCVGVLWMDKPNSDILVTSDQMTTLTTLTYQAGIIIDNFEMYNALENANTSLKDINTKLAELNRDLSLAHAKINKDLDQARIIQNNLLPAVLSDSINFKMSARYIPASLVGGDYYDLFKIDDGVFGTVVADVSGHGVAAAMIMAMTKVLLKTFSLNMKSPKETLEKINQIFQNDIKTDNFVTVFYGIIDTTQKIFRYSSAGHNPIIYLDRQTKKYDLLKADGLFLGVFEDMMLKDTDRTYKNGDRVVLYTDGLTEAENLKGDMYTLERLCVLTTEHADKTSEQFITSLMGDLKNFTGGKPLDDDVTILVIDFEQ